MKDWKDKYYESLEELEAKEKQWGEADQVLRRCLSRMTLSIDSKDSRLDELLERLRNTVRRETRYERIQNMVDAIVETAGEVTAGGNQFTAKEVCDQLVRELPFPEKFDKQKRNLRKRLDYLKDDSALPEICENLATLIAEAMHSEIADAPEKPAGKKAGLLGGLFGKGEKEVVDALDDGEPAVATTSLDDVIHLVRQVIIDLLMSIDVPVAVAAELDRLRQRARRVESRNELQKLLVDIGGLVSTSAREKVSQAIELETNAPLTINEILIQLLERLDLPEDLVEYANELKVEWERGLSDEQVVKALEAIAELVIKIRTRIEHEKNDFQAFLLQVTDRLQMLDQHIRDNVDEQNAIYDENQAFSDNVDGEVEKIQTDVRDASNLDELKTSIAMKLSHISKHVENFRDKEEQRKLQMEIRVGELASKVHQLETETAGLRDKLVEEQKSAMIDALTRIPNRLAWDERLDYEFGRWRRYQSPLALVVWDVDDFKQVNDTYGHKAGDKVLVTIATLLNDQVRETDFIARFGGEEFVMLLPETSLDNARGVVEKLRASVEDCQFHHGETRVPITVSGGMTAFKSGDTIDTAFERADQFLYKAKRSGKNRCISDLDK